MIQLLLYGAIAAALAFGGFKIWTGFTGSYITQGKQQQAKEDAPKLEASEKRATDAEAGKAEADRRAANAKADTQTCIDGSKLQTDKVRGWQDEKNALQARVRMAEAKAREGAENRRAAISAFQERAKSDHKAATCEARLAEADKMVRDEKRARDALKNRPK